MDGGVTYKVVLPARLIDRTVVRRVLTAMAPLEIDAAVSAVRRALAEEVSVEQTRRQQLQRAQEAVDRLRQAYYQADPKNRRVTVDLEEQLERALAEKEQLEARFAQPTSAEPRLSGPDAAELVALARNVEALWSAETTTNEDRKALLRAALVENHRSKCDG